MTILSQIAEKAAKELLQDRPMPDKEDSEEVARVVIQSLVDIPWNLPHSSGAIESVCKEVLRKYVLEEDDANT